MLAVAATVFTYVLSLRDGFNPSGWVRVVGLIWLPIGYFGAAIAYTVARKGPGRRRGRFGLTIAGVGIVAFVVLLFIAG